MSLLQKILGLFIVLACLFTEVVSAKNSAKKAAPKKTEAKKPAPPKGKGKAEDNDDDDDDEDEAPKKGAKGEKKAAAPAKGGKGKKK